MRDPLVFHVFAALAEFISEPIAGAPGKVWTGARARGVRLGRPSAMTAGQIWHARLQTRPGNTVSSIARLLGASRAAICKYVPGLPAGPAFCGPALRAEVTAGSGLSLVPGDIRLCAGPPGLADPRADDDVPGAARGGGPARRAGACACRPSPVRIWAGA